MIEAIITLVKRPSFFIPASIFIYLIVAHQIQAMLDIKGSVWYRFKNSFGSPPWGLYALKIRNELNKTFSSLGYEAKAGFDVKKDKWVIEGEKPRKSLGLTILFFVGLKIIFVPYLCGGIE